MRNSCYFKMTGISLVLVSFAFAIPGCSRDYKKITADPAKQVAAIIKDNGCLLCHSQTAQVPFYGKLPVVGPMVQKDMQQGTRYVDLTPLIKKLENGGNVSQVDMTKVEYAILGGTMPPKKFTAMHWGTSLNEDEKAIIIDWAKDTRKKNFTGNTVAEAFINEPLQPLIDSIPVDPRKVELGFKLYHDTRLSADGTVSCASCHGLHTGGVDRKQYSEGIRGQKGGVNAPTVYNAALNVVQFWDGRAADLKEQAAGPPLNPVEMGHTSFDDIVSALAADQDFKKEFEKVYPQGLSQSTITEAIAEFEKTLLTPSRFDRYLQGDKDALTGEEIDGYALFKANNCATCHVGMNIGGQSFEYMGIKNSYFDYRGTALTDGDNGRYSVTQDENDRHFFKTPTLRNVAITAPYLHDGSVTNLEEAIRYMHMFQVGKDIDELEMKKMVAFLHTLTGEYKGEILK